MNVTLEAGKKRAEGKRVLLQDWILKVRTGFVIFWRGSTKMDAQSLLSLMIVRSWEKGVKALLSLKQES